MKFLILHKFGYSEHDYYNDNPTHREVDSFTKVDSEDDLIKWIKENEQKSDYYRVKGYTVITYQEVNINTTIEVKVGANNG
jgi:Zn/Cd-binding protein ZinT